jgi:hypothetical protein
VYVFHWGTWHVCLIKQKFSIEMWFDSRKVLAIVGPATSHPHPITSGLRRLRSGSRGPYTLNCANLWQLHQTKIAGYTILVEMVRSERVLGLIQEGKAAAMVKNLICMTPHLTPGVPLQVRPAETMRFWENFIKQKLENAPRFRGGRPGQICRGHLA